MFLHVAPELAVTHNWHQIEAYLASHQAPVDVISRGPKEVWLIPTTPVVPEQKVEWIFIRQGSHVHIPLVPYIVSAVPELAMAFMLAQGLRCAFDVQQPLKRIHIAGGIPAQPVTSDPEDKRLRYYVGFALLLSQEG